MVDRCICLNVTFEELQELHRKDGLDFDALQDRTGCSTGCTMCEVYVRLMLDTGATRFAPLSPRQETEARQRLGMSQ